MTLRRRALIIGCVLIVGTIACGTARRALEPGQSFANTTRPPAPDYSADVAWAALPSTVDPADDAPATYGDGQPGANADVFFVYPTTHTTGDWNASVDDESAKKHALKALRYQASVFNDCCRIFAPHYRQAVLFAFMTDDGDGKRAREYAYSDVLRAFDNFVESRNEDRPFIVAGHGQGSYHALRLLEEAIAGTPLQQRLVAAYVVGIPVPQDKKPVPVCKTPEATGCLVTWNTVIAGKRPKRLDNVNVWYAGGYQKNTGKSFHCVNPITWRPDALKNDARSHLGAVRLAKHGSFPDTAFISAQCKNGVLEVAEPPSKYRKGPLAKNGDLHTSDYSLFYLDIRENASLRVRTLMGR